MRGKEGSVIGFSEMVHLRESGVIPNQFYDRSNPCSEKPWYEDLEECIDCGQGPQITKFLKRAFFSLGIRNGISRNKLGELYDSYVKDGKIQ